MKICGFHTTPCHDVAFAVLEDGRPIIHAELERYNRVKMTSGDAIAFLRETYEDADEISHFSCNWRHLHVTKGDQAAGLQHEASIRSLTPESYDWVVRTAAKNGGQFHRPSHHFTHATNAFFSSNFEESLIITIDGGGGDLDTEGNHIISCLAVFDGADTTVTPIKVFGAEEINVGGMWSSSTGKIFGLSTDPPGGNQAGSVMAMAALGDPHKHYNVFYDSGFGHSAISGVVEKLRKVAAESEQERYNVAAALQQSTEDVVRQTIEPFVNASTSRNLCLAGGVALNSVMVGKMWDWFGDRFDNIYVCPVPYDSGVAIGGAQYIWHQVLGNPRIRWEDNFTPYLGQLYTDADVQEALDIFSKHGQITFRNADQGAVIKALADQNIVSVFAGRSESGRRALGNRSILTDPRSESMKDTINEKVKHRQWYRPFAPSILRERVADWFERDVDSPYMSTVINFKKEKISQVPAVVHFDGSARLQTVTLNDNPWYYGLLSNWEAHTGVPILLNTSFNDREPIVETPTHAIQCFLKTQIDFLYFADQGILVSKTD
jgi:carbamoyltransferase